MPYAEMLSRLDALHALPCGDGQATAWPACPDVRLPGLRVAGPIRSRRSRQHTAVLMDLIKREPTVAAPCHLMPSGEKAARALTNVVIDTAERCHRRPQIELARPVPECPVQIIAHLGPGIVIAS